MGVFKKRKARENKAKYDATHLMTDIERKYVEDVKNEMQGFTPHPGQTEGQKDEAVKNTMEKKRELDKEFIAEQFPGFQIVGHVNISRHGKSGAKEKGLGFSVNAPLSEKQKEGLKEAKTNRFTHHLLYEPAKKLTVIASTLLRAKNTASLMIPEKSIEAKNVKVSTDQRLTEDGHWASTGAYTETAGKWKPWWIFSSIFTRGTLRKRTHESAEVDKELRKIRGDTGNDAPELHGGYINEAKRAEQLFEGLREPRDSHVLDAKKKQEATHASGKQKISGVQSLREQQEQDISSLPVEAKVAAINNSIVNHVSSTNPNTGDLWLFGHGGTFKKFFKSVFGLEYNFDYLTTKEIYVLKGPDGKLVYFSPPGAVKMGVDGEMTGVTADHNGVEDRAFVSSNFDRLQFTLDYSERLKKDCNQLNDEIIKLKLEPEVTDENINQLEGRLSILQHEIDDLKKHIEICKKESLMSSELPKAIKEVENMPSHIELMKNMLGAMKTKREETASNEEKPSEQKQGEGLPSQPRL